MIEEILALGFDSLELSHGIRPSQFEGVLQIREKRKFQVSSVHNFMPMPVEVQTDSPDCYEFTSDRATDRERALKLTLATIDWAAKLEAPFVVVHTGRMRSLNLSEPLRAMVEQGKRPAEGRPEIMGITKASLNTDSFEQLVDAVAAGRALQASEVESLIDDGPFLPAEAVEASLVDDLAYDASVAHQLSQLKEQLTQVNNR